MLAEFEAHLRKGFPDIFRNRLLLACSAGLDSTVLAHLIASLGLDFGLAHANFNLRGDESAADRDFVEELAKSFHVKFHVKNFDTIGYLNENKVSIQMAARDLRYSWFRELLAAGEADLLLTAHHADDSLETFLINLSRGTGLDGLTGIPPRQGAVCRPLLPFGRDQLEAYAADRGIRWREDRTNAETDYLRNRFRHGVVPALKQASPHILGQLMRTQEHLAESRSLLDRYVSGLREGLSREEGLVTRFDCAALGALQPLKAHLYELFKDYGFTDWQAVAALLSGETGREVCSPTHRLLRDRGSLLLKPVETTDSREFTLPTTGELPALPLRLHLAPTSRMGQTDPAILYADKETLKEGLTLRKWKKGDYFYPLGMRGRKLVSKYFRDAGMSRFEKEAQWLLCSGKDIVWIVGRRADDRFRVTEKTREILMITCED